jgi:hypothetical protein
MSDIVKVEAPQDKLTTAQDEMAARLKISPASFKNTIIMVAMNGAKRQPTHEEYTAFVIVANQYQLNPLLREIYAFPSANGVVPVVGIDGYISMVLRHPDFDGCDYEFVDSEDGKPYSATCIMYHKKRAHPIRITEYFRECYRSTPAWNQFSHRMLRHKAYREAARVAFGFAGIYDEDEAYDIVRNVDAVTSIISPKQKSMEKLTKRLEAAVQSPAPAPVEPEPDPQPPADVPFIDADTGEVIDQAPPQPVVVETWEQFESVAANFGAEAGVEPEVIARRLKGLALTEASDPRRKGKLAREAIVMLMQTGKFDWLRN